MRKKGLSFIAFFVFSLVGIVTFVSYCSAGHKKKADLVIFSYDRPLQLYALLESIPKYISDLHEIHVIFRASNSDFDRAYQVVHNAFTSVYFMQQGTNPQQDFKPLTLKAVFDSPSEYILFAVDDIVVKDSICLGECIEALEKTGAYGFYLRLGKNLSECYPMQCAQRVPPLQEVIKGIFSWRIRDGQCDWCYPHTVDMTLYRKNDIEGDLKSFSYYSPNNLELKWGSTGARVFERKGLCYNSSKIVNIPLNRMHNEFNNRHMNYATPAELLAIFNEGKKIDIEPLFEVNNKAAHMEYTPTFVVRT